MGNQNWARPDDIPKATSGRIYDYFLGGCHNFAADREAAETVIALNPRTCDLAKVNRAFLGRVVQTLIDHGIRQFLDLGSGIPTVGNVHEIAQAAAPDARIVYVDIDPVAVYHSQILLQDNPLATAIHGDILNPDDLLSRPQVRDLIDLRTPVGLLLVSVLHFCADDAAYEAVAHLRDALTPGSYLAISHVMPDPSVAHLAKEGLQVYQQQTTTPVLLRTREQIAPFFGDFELIDPGLVALDQWRREQHAPDPGTAWYIGGVARKAQHHQ